MADTSREIRVKELAGQHGFLACGIARSEHLQEQEAFLVSWLNEGKHGQMGYLTNHQDVRVNPEGLVEGARSVISLAYNYYPDEEQRDDAPQIAKYAYGKDYHKVLKKKLNLFVQDLESILGAFNCRYFVDSAPILEREWARRAGVGWMGKNTMIINQHEGSFFFLCEVVLDVELQPDAPATDHCGTCTRCLDACPTNALEKPYQMDASKCISYLTIELKSDQRIPEEFEGQMENWMFGCDICQDVCPWNRFSKPHSESRFVPLEKLLTLSSEQWANMNQEEFEQLFEGSAVKRTKYEGLKRNIAFLS